MFVDRLRRLWIRQGYLWPAAVVVCAVLLGAALASTVPAASTLPPRLTDAEFWRLITESSEANGNFPRENLTSNELLYQEVIPDLLKRTRKGDVYLGVGPEQNFTYIAAVQPALAIVFDIRHDNLLLQLMYKSIFELSVDRADFVSMLFSRPRPAGLTAQSTASELFAAFDASQPDDELYKKNLDAIRGNLTKTHRLPLSATDLAGISSTYEAFRYRGFAIRYSPTYAELMTATDSCSVGSRCNPSRGVSRSYLATESNFNVMKTLEGKNLVVPVVGDFGGPKAIRAIGRYLKARGAIVSTFYLSNVEQYLYQDNKTDAFCRNVSTLPLDATSTYIRTSNRNGFGAFGSAGFGGGFVSSLGQIANEIKACSTAR